jgi:hypothetical protein
VAGEIPGSAGDAHRSVDDSAGGPGFTDLSERKLSIGSFGKFNDLCLFLKFMAAFIIICFANPH